MHLRVTTERALAEIFLIDSEFALLARDVGTLDVDVAPGVYRLKAQFGETTSEQLIVLEDDETIDLREQLPIVSPVPLAGTALSSHRDRSLAADGSASVGPGAGSGAEVFLLLRRRGLTAVGDSGAESDLLPSLHAPDGSVVAELRPTAVADSPPGEASVAATVAVDPGAYLLRWRTESGVEAEQSVIAVAGWQLQVFVVELRTPGEDALNRLDVSVLMSPGNFQPDDRTLHLVEEARAALAGGRMVATELVNESLTADSGSPMLSLFGAHLMLVAAAATGEGEGEPRAGEGPRAPVEFDQALFDSVVARLAKELGADHPDVIALSTRCGDYRPGSAPPIAEPPMLWPSWLLAIEASNEAPELVPAEVWRQSLGALPIRPFFVWAPPQVEPEMVKQWERQISGSLHDDQARRQYSAQLVAPRAVIDNLADEPEAELDREPKPEPIA